MFQRLFLVIVVMVIEPNAMADGYFCACDLTQKTCDIGCCCDIDCSQSVLNSFATCTRSYGTLFSCIPRDVLFKHNSRAHVYSSTKNNTCFMIDSGQTYQTMTSESIVSNNEDADKLYTIYNKGSYVKPENVSLPSFYKTNDFINVYFASGTLGIFTPPLSNTCLGRIYLEYLVNSVKRCKQKLLSTDAGASCKSLPSFRALSLANFKLFSRPLQKSDLLKTFDSETLIQVSSFECVMQEDPSISVECSSITPTFDAIQLHCNNVITTVSYRFSYTGGRITDFQVKLFVQSKLKNEFELTLDIQYFQEHILNVDASTYNPTRQLSGTPGYTLGRPVLVGRLLDGIIQFTPFAITLEADQEMASDALYGWWVLPSGGECSLPMGANQLSTVRFGINYASACYLKYKADVAANCSTLDDKIRRILTGEQTSAPTTGQMPMYIGRLGNATSTILSTDWLPVFIKDTNLEAALSEGKTIPVAAPNECQNITVGQVIRIIYAQQGSVGQPKATILGAQISFIRGNIKFVCAWSSCSSSANVEEQAVRITSTISFLDATERNLPIDTATTEYTTPSNNIFYIFHKIFH